MKRLPVIRHIRYIYLKTKVYRFADKMGRLGFGLGYPNESDLQVLQDIWDGKA